MVSLRKTGLRMDRVDIVWRVYRWLRVLRKLDCFGLGLTHNSSGQQQPRWHYVIHIAVELEISSGLWKRFHTCVCTIYCTPEPHILWTVLFLFFPTTIIENARPSVPQVFNMDRIPYIVRLQSAVTTTSKM